MITLIGSDDSIDYIELEQKTAELNAVIQKARIDANLHRLFKGKRRHSSPKRVDDDVEESLQPKKQKTNELDAFNNRTDLMARLSTFSVLFHHIPRPLNALQCAMHGWKDTKSTVDKDPKISVLMCDSCQNNMFVIDLDVTLCNEQKALEVKKKYVDGLYKCHKEDCQWHDNQCEDSLYRFPLFTISDGLEQYKSEAQHIITACLEQHQSLPNIQHPLDKKTLSKVEYLADKDKTLNNKERAYVLSLFGWKSLDPSIPGVKCDLCFARKAFYQLDEVEVFDVVNEHKSYCPCINAETADAYTPNSYSSCKNVKISGADWLKEVILMEYAIIIKREDLSLAHKAALDEKMYALRQKIYESSDNLKNWP